MLQPSQIQWNIKVYHPLISFDPNKGDLTHYRSSTVQYLSATVECNLQMNKQLCVKMVYSVRLLFCNSFIDQSVLVQAKRHILFNSAKMWGGNQGGWGGQGSQGGWGGQQGGWGGQGNQGGWGNQGGYGNQGGFIQPQMGGFMQPQVGVINLGGGGGGFGGFNRWGTTGYQGMSGYMAVDYSNGWNANYHDQLLRNNIDMIYQRYDHNFSGQLEGQEFFFGYRDLCLMMGLCPPSDYQSVWSAVMQSDSNRDGRTSKMEMFILFKRIQGINSGYGF